MWYTYIKGIKMKKSILKRKNLEVLREVTETPCYCCSNIGGKPVKRAKCKICNGTGKYKESQYYHIYTQKDGTKMCIDGELLK